MKLSLFALLGFVLVCFTHCGDPFKSESTLLFKGNIYGGPDALSHEAFGNSVYQITRTHCISCHTSTQPLHASADLRTAHDALISSFKVNFQNIAASRMVAKLRDEKHNCWGDCAANAQEMQAAIESWHDVIKVSNPEPPAPVDTTVLTSESRSLSQELNDSTNPLKTNSVSVSVAAAMLTPPMVRQTDVEGSYVWVPNVAPQVTLGATAANAGRANFSFQVPATGTYTVWALVQAIDGNDNSAYVSIPTAAPAVNNRTWDIGTSNVSSQVLWRRVTGTFSLASGRNHNLEIRQREDGLKIYRLIVTSDASFNGSEVDDYFGVTLSFDLSQQTSVPDAKLLIDVTEYDSFSYKFSRPRIVTSSSNLYVKGLKLLLNKTYNPQHSTYNLVDTIATPQDGVLSTFSMVVLKDQGPLIDKVSFSFDVLQSTNLGGGSVTGSTGGGGDSLGAFSASVYPISRNNCISCHTTRFPNHASDNRLQAHDELLNGNYIDFNNPANSAIVRKLSVQRHNCGSATDCSNLANQYIMAIEEWKAGR